MDWGLAWYEEEELFGDPQDIDLDAAVAMIEEAE